MGTSIAKPGERGALVEGDMIRLAAPDFVLWIVRARMVRIAFDLELASMHAGDRAADAPRLGIPAHPIMNLEVLRHGCSTRCRRKTAKQAVLALNILATWKFQPLRPLSVPRNRNILPTTSALDFGITRLESMAMPARHADSSVGAMTRTSFSP